MATSIMKNLLRAARTKEFPSSSSSHRPISPRITDPEALTTYLGRVRRFNDVNFERAVGVIRTLGFRIDGTRVTRGS